jgi:hypothetical protein
MSTTELIKFILGLIPTLISLVTAIEAAFPSGGNGALKLAFVKNSLCEIDASAGQYWPVLSKIVSAIVTIKNSTGQFVTTGATTTTSAPTTPCESDAGHNG